MSTIRQTGVNLVTVSPSFAIDYKNDQGRRTVKYVYINNYSSEEDAKQDAEKILESIRLIRNDIKLGHVAKRKGFQYYHAVVALNKKRHEKKFPISDANYNEQQKKANEWIELKRKELGIESTKKFDDTIPNVPNDDTMIYGGSVFSSKHSSNYRVLWRNDNSEFCEKLFSQSKHINAESSAKEYLEKIIQMYGNGSICFKDERQVVDVVLQSEGQRFAKRFVISNNLSYDKAIELAENLRRFMSNKLGVTYTKDPPLSKTLHVPETTKQHIAGFFDGDGTCNVWKRGTTRVSFCQSQNDGIPVILTHIQSIYGGNIRTEKRSNNPKHRDKHVLCISEEKLLWDIVRDMIPYSTLKKQQLQLVWEFLVSKRCGNNPCWEQYNNQIKTWHNLSEYQTVNISADQLSYAYLSGLFDAEGCACLDKKLCYRMEIAQKSSPSLLKSIQMFTKQGKIHKGKIQFGSSTGMKLARQMLPFSVQKKDQLKDSITIMQDMQDRIPIPKRKEKFEEIYNRLKRAKTK